MNRPRVLCYAVNGLGLGHLTRVMAIARQVRALAPAAEILFLTSNEAAGFCLKEGFAAFKVPSRSGREAGRIRPSLYTKTVQSVTWSLVSSFDPNLLVVDSFPSGAIHELLPLLRWSMKKVFVFREQRITAASDPYFQNTLSLYDLLVLPHDEAELDLPLPSNVKSCCVGPILLRDRSDALPRQIARAELAGCDTKRLLCYVNFGGGGDARVCKALDATIDALANHSEVLPVVAPGPFAEWRRRGSRDVVVSQRYPIAPYFSGLDMAISAAGYNTHAELLHFGVPTAFSPFAKGLDDQAARIRRSLARGAALELQNLTPEHLDQAIATLKRPDVRRTIGEAASRAVPTNGAQLAAERILDLLP